MDGSFQDDRATQGAVELIKDQYFVVLCNNGVPVRANSE